MSIQDEDGNIIKMTLLKKPISLNSLIYENDVTPNVNTQILLKQNYDLIAKQRVKKAKEYFERNVKIDDESKLDDITLLKEPISLDDIEWCNAKSEGGITTVTFNVKTVQGTYFSGKSRKRNSYTEDEISKRNALLLYEFSTVYPFMYCSNTFKCFVCYKTFLKPNFLGYHINNEHTVEDLKQELDNRSRDKTIKVDVNISQCKLCLVVIPNLNDLKKHLKDIHAKNVDTEIQDNIIPFKLGEETHNCQICGEVYQKLRLLIIHMSVHFNNYNCEVCGSVFITQNLLKRHLQIHETGDFPCDKCDKVFTSSSKRSVHKRGVHLKQITRRCPICPARFISTYQRTKHLKVVHNETSETYKCQTCGKEYNMKYHLSLHIRSVHLQERNHECTICHCRFFSKECLNRHIVIHTGEKNFKCETCGKAYTRKKNLKEHIKTHALSQFMCYICGLNCVDHPSLAAHVSSFHRIL